MQAQYVNVSIDMGVMSKLDKQVLAHEVALLRLVRGEDTVMVHGIAKDEHGKPMTREVDGNQEYERLAGLFGAHPDTNQLHVEILYGRRGSGGLRAAIKGGLKSIPAMNEMEGEDEPGDENAEEPSDPLELADADDSGYTNMDEIRSALIDAGVDYSSKAKRAELVELLSAAGAVVASGGDPAGKSLDEMIAMAEQATAA